MARQSTLGSVLVLTLCLAATVASETDLVIRLDDRQSDGEKECAVFLLKARLGDSDTEVPHQCQDMVRSYLEEEGEKLNVKKECSSFLLNGELNNIQGWMPPPECEDYIASYMEDGQYEVIFISNPTTLGASMISHFCSRLCFLQLSTIWRQFQKYTLFQ